MAKSSYLSNSAKILAALSGMLLLANLLVAIGSIGGIASVSKIATSFSNLCVYIVLIMGYIAFNGEAVCHKRYRNRKRKRLLGFFKLLLLLCFLLRYIKVVPENLVATTSVHSIGGIVARLFMSLLSTIGSFGFLFGAISLWYFIRDKEQTRLVLPQLLSLVMSIAYNLFKFMNYAVGKYQIEIFGESLSGFFARNEIAQILCVFQFLMSLIMLVCVTVYYSKKGEGEQEILDKNTKELKKARIVYNDEGFGIDTFEDDFLTSEN